ncbi:MAG: hypothetical protein E7035_05560 [Verrucomicrobiaceae bacterium]|nr:hypothetical protein [Verrucomicrobiaceae bacterium]
MRSKKNQILISLHGIRTRGVWQKKITPRLTGFKHYPLDYGFFSTLKFLNPFSRKKMVEWFRDEYNKIVEENQGMIPSIVAHSFGTYIVAEAMKCYQDIHFDKIILAGSIVKNDFNFEEEYKKNRYTSLLNFICKRDIWVKLAGHIYGFGNSGVYNFSNSNKIDVVKYENMGHSDMLEDDVFRNKMVPFLRKLSSYNNGDSPIRIIDQISTYDVAVWSALTYKEQFVQRYITALASGYFFNDENEQINQPKRLNIIIPSSPSEASSSARIIYFKDYNKISFKINNGDRRSAFYDKGELYDIPSIIGTSEILSLYSNEDEAKNFIHHFSDALRNLTKNISNIEITTK